MALIYIVEDDENIREIEAIALKNSGHMLYECEDAKSFFKAMSEKCPDLALVDVMLPDEDGYEIVRKLRGNEAFKRLPVIMVTAKTMEIDMIKGLDIGADDYIRKPFSVIELITRVKALLRRTEGESLGTVMCVGNIVMDNDRHIVHVDGRLAELTFKEYELLKFLMSNVGIVMTRAAIMRKVWGTDFGGGTRTVDMHIKTLRQKLKNSGAHIRTVRNVGYVME